MSTLSDETVTVGGLRLRTRVEGAAGAPWLVFANSLMTDLTLWDAQVAAFAGRFRILRYDQRGHGGSDVPPDACRFPDLVCDLAAILDHHGIERTSVVGVSMGGVTALGFAAKHPDRVERVAVCDCQARSTPAGAAAWDERIALTGDGGMAALVEPTVRRWFTPASLAAGHPALDHVRRMIAGTSRAGFVQGARALQDYDFGACPAALRCPAAFVVGAQDGALPDVMRAMAAAAPDAVLTAIPEAGHLPNLERLDRFNAVLAAFLDHPART